MLKAIEALWCYTGELFEMQEYETQVNNAGIAVDLASLKPEWITRAKSVMEEATLPIPENIFMQCGGKEGVHTENLGFILTELQYMQRAYPNSSW